MQRQLRGVADAIALLVQLQFDLIRPRLACYLTIAAPAPACGKMITCHHTGIRVDQLHPITAPLHWNGQLKRASTGAEINRRFTFQVGGTDHADIKTVVVAVIPTVVAPIAQYAHFHLADRMAHAGYVTGDYVKFCGGIAGCAVIVELWS